VVGDDYEVGGVNVITPNKDIAPWLRLSTAHRFGGFLFVGGLSVSRLGLDLGTYKSAGLALRIRLE
jgi:hypothetical protein